MTKKEPKKKHQTRYGEGSFRWVPSTKQWRGRFDTGQLNSQGNRIIITAADRDEDKAWQKFQAAKKRFILEGAPVEGVRIDTTVRQWANEWLEEHKERVKPRTYANDESRVRRHIVPAVGKIRLTELTAQHLNRLAKRVRDSGASATSANNVQRTFIQILREAKGAGHNVPDRVFHARRAKPSRSTRRALTVAEAATILKHAWDATSDHSRWDVALFQGVRRGEALGLTWDRVNLEEGLLDISWQLQALPYEDREKDRFAIPDDLEALRLEGAFHLTRPKTEAGERVIPMIPQIVDIMKAWREIAPKSPYGLVWPRGDGRPRNLKADLQQWKDLQDATGVVKDPTIEEGKAGRYFVGHELRHTTISLLVAAGVPDRIIEQIVGQTTLVDSYVHADVDAMRKALLSIGLSLKSIDG